MLETSGDILKIVSAISIGALAFLLCWGLFYIIMALRNILLATRDARRIFDKIEDILNAIKDKIHSSASYLIIISEILKKIFDFLNKSEGRFNFPKFGKKNKSESKKGKSDTEEESDCLDD
jgi:hypothetical protein